MIIVVVVVVVVVIVIVLVVVVVVVVVGAAVVVVAVAVVIVVVVVVVDDDDDDEDDVDIGREGAAAKRCAECLLLDFTMNKFPPTSPSLLLPVPSPPFLSESGIDDLELSSQFLRYFKYLHFCMSS